jgi:hypothetical protein
MRLGISAAADRSASATELLDVCRRRGMAALELNAADGDGRDDEVVRAAAADVTVSIACDALSPWLVAQARAAGVTLILDGPDDVSGRIVDAMQLRAQGVAALPVMRGPADTWLDDVVRAGIAFAWQIDDGCDDAAGDCARILRHAGLLAYVRLVGGGPETALQEGRGIGAVMRQLALSGFAGPLILTPSSPRYRLAWARWLGRRGGWGCGGKTGDAATLRLAPEGSA